MHNHTQEPLPEPPHGPHTQPAGPRASLGTDCRREVPLVTLPCVPFWVRTASSGHASCNTATTWPHQCPLPAGLSPPSDAALPGVPEAVGCPAQGRGRGTLSPAGSTSHNPLDLPIGPTGQCHCHSPKWPLWTEGTLWQQLPFPSTLHKYCRSWGGGQVRGAHCPGSHTHHTPVIYPHAPALHSPPRALSWTSGPGASPFLLELTPWSSVPEPSPLPSQHPLQPGV